MFVLFCPTHVLGFTAYKFVSVCVSAELRQSSSHPSPATPSSSQEPASAAHLQRPSHRQPFAQSASSTSSRPSAWHAASCAPTAPGNLHQLPPQPAAFACGSIPLGLQQLPQLSKHPTQYAVASHPQAELPAQHQPEQPLPSTYFQQRSTCPSTSQPQPTTPQTPTKDIQKGAAAAATTRSLTGGEHQQQPVSLLCSVFSHREVKCKRQTVSCKRQHSYWSERITPLLAALNSTRPVTPPVVPLRGSVAPPSS